MAASVQAPIGMDLEAVARKPPRPCGQRLKALAFRPVFRGPIYPNRHGEPAKRWRDRDLRNRDPGQPRWPALGRAMLFVQTAAASQTEITTRNLSTGAGPANAKRFNQVCPSAPSRATTWRSPPRDRTRRRPWMRWWHWSKRALARRKSYHRARPRPRRPTRLLPPRVPVGTSSTGIAASPGVAVGTVVVLARLEQAIPRNTIDNPTAEWLRYQAAIDQAKAERGGLAKRMARELGPQQARIFQAHALVLDDEDLASGVRDCIEQQHLNAEAAMNDV